MTPALVQVDKLPDDMRFFIRSIIRSIVCSPIVKSDLGVEGGEECITRMYDIGALKFTFEPIDDVVVVGRIMLYDTHTRSYRVVDTIDITMKRGGL